MIGLTGKQSQRTFTSDHNSGKVAERASHNDLQTLSKNELHLDPDVYAHWDFYNQTTLIEHKARGVYSDSYDSTMIQGLKVQRAYDMVLKGYRVFFAFRFLDGLFYIRFRPEKFDSYYTDTKKLDDRVDYTEKECLRYYIPLGDLKCLARFEVKPLFLDD